MIRATSSLINNTSIKTKFLLVLVLIITVATLVVAATRAVQIQRQTNTMISERLQGNANLAVGIFETVRIYTVWMLDAVATMPYVREALITDTDAIYDNLRRNLLAFFTSMNQVEDGVHAYANIFVFDADLHLLAAAYPAGESINIFYGAFSENIRMAQDGYSHVSPVVESPQSGLTQFLFTQPVIIDGGFAGMVAILSNTEVLAFFLRDPTHDYDSFINIADSAGTIFFSNRPAYIGRHVDDLGVVEAFGYVPINTMFEHLSAITGIDKIAYITVDPSLGWTIVSFFDADAVDSIYWIIFISLLPTVSGIILASIFLVLIVHMSLKPLVGLAANAKEVARGNLAVHFDITRKDEIGQVSQSFMEIVTSLNTLQENFKKPGTALTADTRLGGIYDEMQRLKIEAESASKAKSDFLSKMSHEIRTPLNAVLGMAELMLRENLPDAAREQAMTIKQSGDHLLSIVNDILDLSKVESGKLELVNTGYLFHSTINDVISIIKMRKTNPDLNFAVYMQHDIPNGLFGDEVRLRQILINVLTNALKYTRKGHFSLDVTGEKTDDSTIMLTMTIKDTGIGIKQEDMQRLFAEFAQFDLEKNRNVEGTGLGLAITHNLIKLMGGEINAFSEYGKGSEFIIRLPQKLHESGQAPETEDDWPLEFKEKSVLLYCSTPIYTDYIARTLKDLRVNHHIVCGDSELHNRLLEGTWDYVFAEEKLAHTAQHIVKNGGVNTSVVMMSNSYDVKDSQEFSILMMPAYLLSIVSVLTGRDMSYFTKDMHLENFIAPDARILLVDDINTNLKVGEGLLKQYGVHIDMCLSGKEAIEAIVGGDYDLVLMDHMMPEMDGIEAVRIIRNLAASMGEKYALLPIIALTANAIVGAKEMFMENGFNDFLSKPIETIKLNSILSKWIPKEKQKISAGAVQEEEPPLEIVIEDVDTKKGIALSGGSGRNYLDTLKIFLTDGEVKVKELSECLENNDLSLYTTYVHALKSACANIGAAKLSEDAKILEDAGRNRDMNFIAKHNSSFVDSLKKVLANIDEVVSTATAKLISGKTLNVEEMKSHLVKLKAALETFNMQAMDEASLELQNFIHFPGTGKALSDILQNAFAGEYEQAVLQIQELLVQENP
ncbi:MAG: ATP-binding protein [Treponema sp.]|nr:ATP-binding protein [Treponema sp.]